MKQSVLEIGYVNEFGDYKITKYTLVKNRYEGIMICKYIIGREYPSDEYDVVMNDDDIYTVEITKNEYPLFSPR